MKITVKRYNTEKGSYDQTYDVEIPSTDTVLMALLKIRSEQDQTLGVRCSCRSAICGSCAMKMNKKSGLACNTRIDDAVDRNGNLYIEPAGNMNVIRDLIVDFDFFFDKIESIDPFLKDDGLNPEREHLCSNEHMIELSKVTECILCGSCVSDCTVMEVDKKFLGPAALAKVFRFVDDPRDTANKERLNFVNQPNNMWDCTHCFKCVEACPKRVLPMDRILELRKRGMEAGFTNTYGAKHSKAIIDSVEHSGTLNEGMVMPQSYGFFNFPKLLGLLPVAMRMMKAGKMPPMIHPKLPGTEKIKNLFKKFKH